MKTVSLRRVLAMLGLFVCASILVGFSCNSPAPSTVWGQIQYRIYTGKHGLDGSKATGVGMLKLNNGTELGCTLNTTPPILNQNELPNWPGGTSWNSDSLNTVICSLVNANVKGTAVTTADVNGAQVSIAQYQSPCQTSCANWSVEGVQMTLVAQGSGTPSCQLQVGFFGPGDQGDSPAVAYLQGGNSTGSVWVAFSTTFFIPQVCVPNSQL